LVKKHLNIQIEFLHLHKETDKTNVTFEKTFRLCYCYKLKETHIHSKIPILIYIIYLYYGKSNDLGKKQKSKN